MPELKALAKERGLRRYSMLRKAELIALLQNNEHQVQRPPPPPPQMSTWEPQREPQNEVRQPELEAPKGPEDPGPEKRRRNKDSKLNKQFKNLEKEVDNLKSQMDALKDKITKASESTNARFKKRKIRSMKKRSIR